jgi:GNAT superfamily N-acetyltransferase
MTPSRSSSPPVTAEDVRPEWRRHLTAIAEGRMRLLVGRDEDGRIAATAFLAYNTHRLMTHWVWLHTVMVHPRHQGKGHGRDLMAAAAQAARGFDGIEAIRLTCRGGSGADRFYAACGYKEVGRVPGAIRVADGDDRDDVIMLLPLG